MPLSLSKMLEMFPIDQNPRLAGIDDWFEQPWYFSEEVSNRSKSPTSRDTELDA